MSKADKDYVLNGVIYLKGAEMPEDWVKPPEPKNDPGVMMFGPHGQIHELPGMPMPPGVAVPAPVNPADMAFEDLVHKLQERGLRIEMMPTTETLADKLTAEVTEPVIEEPTDSETA